MTKGELVESSGDESYCGSEDEAGNADDFGLSSREDINYVTESESDTDDGLSDTELASDDEEYIDARIRNNIYKMNEKQIPIRSHNVRIDFTSDYEDSNREIDSDSSEESMDEGSGKRKKMVRMTYDPKCDHKELQLQIGMRFDNAYQCKHAIQTISLEHGYPIHFTRSNKHQCEASCIPKCGWGCYGSFVKRDRVFILKRVSLKHTCPREIHNKQATAEWIANEYLETFRERPHTTIKELELDIMKRFACQVSRWRLYRARWKALTKLRGTLADHYAIVRNYVAELLRVDPEGISTYLAKYKLALEDLKAEDEAACLDFLNREPQRFCKAYISTFPLCDTIVNNVSETFNGFILQAREKLLTEMLEAIRKQLMLRQYTKLAAISGVTDRLCPKIHEKLEDLKLESRHCTCTPALQGKFEVCHRQNQFIVDMPGKKCSCRAWDLTGIPCIHAISAITFLKEEPSDFVSECYTVMKYIEAYKYGIEPTNGPTMWPHADGYPVLPPLVRKMPGRPKKKRKRGVEEKECLSQTKLHRFGMQMTFRRCLQVGHNKTTCKNEAVNIPSTTRVRSGFGIMEFAGTGNIYARMPGDNRVRHLNSVFEPGFNSRGRGETRGRGASRGRGAGPTLGNGSGSTSGHGGGSTSGHAGGVLQT
ncbi:hypothetical protein C2S52_015003 [Perilla frutescens var. hirtella]|nr:hypothetical protein C2S52_015003 [Perilla frutescens var. hirtella]